MKVQTTAKVVTCFVYDKKDKTTGEKNGEKGIMISLLIDEKSDDKLSGKVISPFVNSEEYKGIIDFSNISRMENVLVSMDVPTSPKGMFVLYDLQTIQNKK